MILQNKSDKIKEITTMDFFRNTDMMQENYGKA